MKNSLRSKAGIPMLVLGLVCAAAATFAQTPSAPDASRLDLRSIPVSDWLNGGGKDEIDWSTGNDSRLRMDQRIELSYWAAVPLKSLSRSGTEHDLFLISRFSTPQGEWLNETTVMHHDVGTTDVRFSDGVLALPGNYVLWMILYDRKTGLHSTDRRHIRVDEILEDPLPSVNGRQALIEPTEPGGPAWALAGSAVSALYLPVANARPLDVHVIAGLGTASTRFGYGYGFGFGGFGPSSGSGRTRRRQSDPASAAMATFAQLTLRQGSVSLSALDLAQRHVLLERTNTRGFAWSGIREEVRSLESSILASSRERSARPTASSSAEFLRDYIAAQLGGGEGSPTKVLIVITGPPQFDREQVVIPLEVPSPCDCRLFHIRMNPNRIRSVDDLADIVKPLQPRTFDVQDPAELRRTIAGILAELQNL